MTLSKRQIELLKKNIDKMYRSDEQFIFIIFKNPNGTENITKYSYNIPVNALEYYLMKALKRGKIKDEKNWEKENKTKPWRTLFS